VYSHLHIFYLYLFFFSSRRRHTRSKRDWSSDVCSSDLPGEVVSVKVLGVDVEKERISLSIKATLPDENVTESDSATTQSYLESGSDDEDNPTLGDVFGDKLKDFKF